MVNAKTKKTVKSTGSSPARKSSKQKLSVKKTTSNKKQQKVKTTSRKSTSKNATTKVAAQRKSSKANSNNGVYKAKNTLKVRRTNVNELKKVENVIERLSQGPEPSTQKTVTVAQEIAPTVRRTVPGVLRIVHDVQDTVPSAPKTVPIVEAGNFLKKCVKQYWASA
ncbi:MAG: hypothetical protein MAG551_00137 [Candidatus Scalindua arabica]|uniref:Uncharacterized protein n=1 Tax=Candidatus Scalindua arabica TaxID=1127984 RepID=A0A942A3P2_9BACT|nr:hypothetical protein [Candidatus Scalindua arabica]